MLLISDPRGLTSGAGFFQSHPKENYQRAWQTRVPALLGDSGFLHTNSWRPRPLEPRGVRTHSLESLRLASDSLLPMSGLLWRVSSTYWLFLFLQSFKSTNVYALFYIIYYVHMSLLLVYHLWLRHCFEAPHPLSLGFCYPLLGEKVVVFFV